MQNPPKAFGFWWILFKPNHAVVAWFEIGFALTSRLHRRKVWEFKENFYKSFLGGFKGSAPCFGVSFFGNFFSLRL
jgi:hypothetical protein